MSKPSPSQNSSVDTSCAPGIIRASVDFPAAPCPPIPTRTKTAVPACGGDEFEQRLCVHCTHGTLRAWRSYGSAAWLFRTESSFTARPHGVLRCACPTDRSAPPPAASAGSGRTSALRSSEARYAWRRPSPSSPMSGGPCPRPASRSSDRVSQSLWSRAPPPQVWRGGRGSACPPGRLSPHSHRCVPAAIALRGGELASYHGAEHISIGTYETRRARHEGARSLRWPPRRTSPAHERGRECARSASAVSSPFGGTGDRCDRRRRGCCRGLCVDGTSSSSPGLPRARATRARAPDPRVDR